MSVEHELFPKPTEHNVVADMSLYRESLPADNGKDLLWNEIERAGDQNSREMSAKKYVGKLEQLRLRAIEYRKTKGDTSEDLILIDASYRAEMVKIWSITGRDPNKVNYMGLDVAVRWQQSVADYLYEVNKAHPRPYAHDKLKGFWESQKNIISYVSAPEKRSELSDLAEKYRNGILRAVAARYVLESLDWRIHEPLSSKEDIEYQIDLRGQRNGRLTGLFQVKPTQNRDDPYELYFYNPEAPRRPIDDAEAKFNQGVSHYIHDEHLDPHAVRGLLLRLSARDQYLDRVTGRPQATYLATLGPAIEQEFNKH
ncbi:MAG: hypothetical protein WD200_03160 [Candidatus Andersenbacteria bacterium]